MAQLGILSPIPIIEKILSRMVILIYSQHHFSIAAVHLTSKLLYDCIKLHSVQVVIQLIQKNRLICKQFWFVRIYRTGGNFWWANVTQHTLQSMKALKFLLIELHLSPAVYLEKFNTLVQDKNETYSQFSTWLTSLFEYYIGSRKIGLKFTVMAYSLTWWCTIELKSAWVQLYLVMFCRLKRVIRNVGWPTGFSWSPGFVFG